MENRELLRVNHLKKYFQTPSGTLSAVDDVTLALTAWKPWGWSARAAAERQRWGGAFSDSTSRLRARLFLKTGTSSNAARRK